MPMWGPSDIDLKRGAERAAYMQRLIAKGCSDRKAMAVSYRRYP